VFGTLERTMVPPLNRVRGQLGLAPVAGADDIFGRVPLLLYLTAEPFEYPRRDWPGNVVLVGPCDWDPPADPPGWLEQLDRPVVLVTTSSEFQDDHRLVKVTLQALAEEPVAVVVTLPAGDPPAVRVPANARVERFLPHGLLLDRAVCASPTAAWAPPKRRWPTACRCAPSPSAATSWRSPGGWRSPARARGCPHGAYAPTGCAPR
jgi:UDP:flavonoid glycosyltransferase YjiC (YdhE family)